MTKCLNINHPEIKKMLKFIPNQSSVSALMEMIESKKENLVRFRGDKPSLITAVEVFDYYKNLLNNDKISPIGLPLMGNEALYKANNLLSNDGKIKSVEELNKEGQKNWVDKLNKKSEYAGVYYFKVSQTTSGKKIIIYPVLERPTAPDKSSATTQLPLFSKEITTVKGNNFNEYISGNKSDSQTVLKQLSQTGGALASVAKQLLKSGLNIPIEIVDVNDFNKNNFPEGEPLFDESLGEDFKAAAFYSPITRKIYLAKGANVENTAGILLHEILHGYTSNYILTNPNSAAVKNLDRLLKYLQTDQVKQMLGDTYPLTNVDELLVAIYSNKTFIEDLKKLPPTNKNFKSVWDELLQIFKVIFGISDKTLFDEIFAYSSQIVEESMQQMEEFEIADEIGYIKPGVEELFDSTPELANQVYEALGYSYTGEYSPAALYESGIKTPDKKDYLTYSVVENKSGKKYINTLNKGKKSTDKGIGKNAYYKFIIENQGKNITTDVELSVAGRKVLEVLEKEGYVIKTDAQIVESKKSGAGYDLNVYNKPLYEFTGKIPDTYLTPQQKQHALQLYSQYLDTIFPDSKVKDIVYHGTKGYDSSGKELPKFEKFDKSLIGKKNGLRSDDMAKGFYFASYNIADRVGTRIIPAILNIEEENNTTVRRNTKDFDTTGDVFVVFEPEQIHILGSKQDIENFAKFVGKSKPLASPVSNVQKIISDRLDILKSKVQNINQKYIVEGFDIEWLRPSETAKKVIQKRTFGLSTEQQEEFQRLAQEAGTTLHDIEANIIKEAFPEYNQHIEKAIIDEGLIGFEQAIKKQLTPIIEEAKKRGSIMKAEVWVGNTKSTKGGTIDILEITKEGDYIVYDLKTRFSEDVSPLRRYTKILEWSEQTSEYNDILKSGDASLGVVKGKILGTYILELDVQIKPENKFTFNGTTSYKKTTAERFLKKRELKDIRIVAPTFLLTGDKKIDETINKVRNQIENLSKRKPSQEQREAFNQVFQSKLELLQSLQLKKDINRFIQSAYLELSIIRKQLEDKNLSDTGFIEEQLELYTNALRLLDPPEELKEQIKKVQSEAYDLKNTFQDLRKEIFVESAQEVEVTKREDFGNDVFAPQKDVSWVFSKTMGVADIDNPIVQTVFRKTMIGLQKSREKVQELGNKMIDLSNAYIKTTGDKTYSKLIENGHLVDEWQTEFWKEFNDAKKRKDFDWAKDNVNFDEKSYIEARDRQLDFHESVSRSVYTNKIKLENPNLQSNEIKRLVEAEIAAQMKKWDSTHKNAFTYFTPKSKWTNPKYTSIMNGPTEVKEMYIFLKNLLEYANEIIPEKVKKNFIPNYQRDYIEKASQLGLLGAVKASWSGFFDGIEVGYDDEVMSQKDAVTGEKLGVMWIPGVTEIENKSLDLAVVFFKFMEGVYRYEELKSLEELAISAKKILKEQQWVATDILGNAISIDKTPARPNPASKTLALFEGWVNQVFYNKSLEKDFAVELKGNGFTEAIGLIKKGDSKLLSIGKMVDKVIKWTTLKNLGFSIYSPLVNLFGGSANMYATGANGLHYTTKDLNKAFALALAGKTNVPSEDVEKANLILKWLNIDSGEFIKKQEDKLSNSLTKKLMSEYNALALMRESENVLRNAGALAVIIGGKYNYNWDSFKVVDGKLVVEANNFQKSQLRQQIIKINRKNIGGINEDDIMLAKQAIVGRMLMQHRSWLPALFFERFGGKRYDWVLGKDIEGRYVTAARLFKHLVGLSKIKDLSEYEKSNLKSVRAELALLVSIGILRALLKAGLDDDDKKEAWYKISEKVSSRTFNELIFFVDPTFESQYQILLSPAPVLGTAGDVGKFVGSLYNIDDEDKRTKTPLQRAIKLTPISKVDAFLTDLGLSPFDEK